MRMQQYQQESLAQKKYWCKQTSFNNSNYVNLKFFMFICQNNVFFGYFLTKQALFFTF